LPGTVNVLAGAAMQSFNITGYTPGAGVLTAALRNSRIA
jgi:hypothetical protein